MTQRLTIVEVRARFQERGYELLGDNYQKNSVPMRFRCPTHPDKETKLTMMQLKAGQGCRYCGYAKMGERQRLSPSIVKELFLSRGYKLLDEYITSSHKLRYVCPGHPNVVQEISYSDLRSGHGCMQCGRERTAAAISGEKSHFWKGGVSELGNYLRQHLSQWKLDALKKYDYRCVITGQRGKDIEIHHTKPFYQIRDEAMAEIVLDVRQGIGDYAPEELTLLTQVFVRKHLEVEGIPLKRELHIELHKSFGDAPSLRDFLFFKTLQDRKTNRPEVICSYGQAV